MNGTLNSRASVFSRLLISPTASARVPGFPITAYDDLSVRQIDRRIQELSRADVRRVRDYERRNKSRKGVLRSVDRKLNDA